MRNSGSIRGGERGRWPSHAGETCVDCVVDERLLELAPHATGFKIAFEAIVRGGKGLCVLEVPIAFVDRKRGTSKMNFRVALLFGFRWLVAAGRMVLRR